MGTAVGVLIAAATLFEGGHAGAEQSTAALSNLQVSRATLDNGLRVVINQDHTVPTVAISVYYDVGSRNEVKGRTVIYFNAQSERPCLSISKWKLWPRTPS